MATGVYVKSFSPLYGGTVFSSYSNLTPVQKGEDKPFSPPAQEMRVANARRQARQPANENQQNQTRIASRIGGENVEEALQNVETANISGGSRLSISDGAMSFTTSGGESLEFEPGTEARFFRDESGQLNLQDLENNESITIRTGEEIELSGEGTAELSGANRNLTLESGESIQAQAAQGQQTQLVRSSTATSLSLTEAKQISVEDNNLTFLAEGGRTIEFEPGQTGEITRNEANQVTITNANTGEAISFSPESTLSTIGKGTASLGHQGEMTIEGSQGLQLDANEMGNTTLTQPQTAQTATVEGLDSEPGVQGRLSVDVYSDPQSERLKLSTEKLLREPLEQAKKAREEQKEAEEEERAAEESEESEEAAAEAEEAEQTEEEEAEQAEEAEAEQAEEAEENAGLFEPPTETEEESPYAPATEADETDASTIYSPEATEANSAFGQSSGSNVNNFYTAGGRAQLSGTSINYTA